MKRLTHGILFAVFIILGTLLAACSAIPAHLSAPKAPLIIDVIDIGQGDASLIRTAKEVILIDTGDVSARGKLVDYLKKQGITTIDKVIITHPHADHLGGMASVLENFTVKQIYDSGQTTTTALYRQYLSTVKKRKIPFAVLAAGDQLDFGGGVTFKVFGPQKPYISDSELNNNSIVGKLIYGQFSMLFTGDAEKEAEERLQKNYASELRANVLKSPHHGSRTSSSWPFLKAVSPDAITISAGADNEYQHPHTVTLKKYTELKAQIYRTDLNGSIRITSDGKTYQMIKEKP